MATTKYIVNNLENQTITGDLDIQGTLKSSGTGVYRALLTQTGPLSGTSLDDFNSGLIIGESYTIDFYVSGDDFSNIADVTFGAINETGCVFTATGQIPANYSNGTELSSSGGLIIDVLENTLGYDLLWIWSQDPPFFTPGFYTAFNNTTGPVYNAFQRDKIEIITPLKFGFDTFSPFPPFITPFVGNFIGKDDSISISVIEASGPGPGSVDNLLYYTPIEIKINQDTDITPIEVYGEILPSFPFVDNLVGVSLYCGENLLQNFNCDPSYGINNISDLLSLLNSQNPNILGVYSEGGPGGIKLTMPTNFKNQFCSNGILTFEVYSYSV